MKCGSFFPFEVNCLVSVSPLIFSFLLRFLRVGFELFFALRSLSSFSGERSV